MTRHARMITLTVTLATLGVAPAAWGAPDEVVAGAAPPTPAPRLAPDRVIVEFEPGVDGSDRAASRSAAGTRVHHSLGSSRFQLLTVESGQTVAGAISDLRDDPSVRVAERDGYDTLHTASAPNDPSFDRLWGLRNLGGTTGIEGFPGPVPGADVDVLDAWDTTVGTPSTVIADLDSGYRSEYADLSAVQWTNTGEIAGNGIDDDGNGKVDDTKGWDFVGHDMDHPVEDNDPSDDDLIAGGHGVHTAGTMGAKGNDGVGITGVAQNARIMPLRICSYSAINAASLCPFSAEVAAINYAGRNGARVANMSLGGTTQVTSVRDALAGNPQTLFVISAGNDNQNNDQVPHYPCNFVPTDSNVSGAIDNVICVAATDQADGRASFSDYGATSVDLGAPGTQTYSTYPSKVQWTDDFQTGTFATRWPDAGGTPGFQETTESPLTSTGMTDTPGGAPAASTLYQMTSAGISIPADAGACTFTQTRNLALGGGTFNYAILRDGVGSLFTSANVSSSGTVATVPFTGAAGGTLHVRYRFTSDSTPVASEGVWLDNLQIECKENVGSATGYAYLQGTSMAAPHVTGAAALLFSYVPSATVTQAKQALLAGVDPVASLSGKTTTGGRLNVAQALAPRTSITSTPAASTTDTGAAIAFTATGINGVNGYECRLDGSGAGGWSACTSPQSLTVGVGAHTFQVRATDSGGTADPSPASSTWTVNAPPVVTPPATTTTTTNVPVTTTTTTTKLPATTTTTTAGCVVPSLAGKSRSSAEKALQRAACKLGKVSKPKKKKGKRLGALVVKASTPPAGTRLPAGSAVDLKLKKKPKAKAKRGH